MRRTGPSKPPAESVVSYGSRVRHPKADQSRPVDPTRDRPADDVRYVTVRELGALADLSLPSVREQLKAAGLRPARRGLRWMGCGPGGQQVLRPVAVYDRATALAAVRRKIAHRTDASRPGQRRCSRCGEHKPYPAEFPGARAHCRPCAREHTRAYREAHREQVRQNHREHRARLRGERYVPRGGLGPSGVPGAA